MSEARTPAEHLSIGEVLATLRDEFPDITISKIRFLESQGLIDPERTPSGYRKFYTDDVNRLRWILQQQKEHFLPLKVIKTRLDEHGGGVPPPEAEPSAATAKSASPAGSRARVVDQEAPPPEAAEPDTLRHSAARAGTAPAAPKSRRTRRKRTETPPLPLDDGPDDDLAGDVSGASLTRADLVNASGLTDEQVAQLEEYGLLVAESQAGNRALFDEDALTIARHAAVFLAHGIDARHLRMYKAFAEREGGYYEQVVFPLLRQRNPEARAKARDEVVALARAGRGLRAAYLRRVADDLLAE